MDIGTSAGVIPKQCLSEYVGCRVIFQVVLSKYVIRTTKLQKIGFKQICRVNPCTKKKGCKRLCVKAYEKELI